ncbi:fatty acid desaturase [Gayadomonas joobiniege]|uniref:fatty acid desaturase n=1 Tax=Gayadomonas joobiniege TaxID=1234606 RepID=UPI00036A3F1E|nr:fatty acid desaturase [Gayadomonas joobiniege]
MNKAPIVWVNVLVFSVSFLLAATLVPWYAIRYGFTGGEIIAGILCLGYSGMSITAGYHRLWSHKTYQAHAVIRFFYAIGGAFALQNSILHWASDHRNHHKHVDVNGKDPYSAKQGFWFSHIGWMLREYQGENYRNYDNVRDLQKDKIVMWQHKHYLTLVFTTNIGIPLLLGLISGNMLAMFLLAGLLRLVLSHHFTFFINSLAHIWGKQTYSQKHTARDNHWLALLTYGEGYHNFHHTFEYDYRNGIKWWQFDPTKWFIKAASWFGLTSKLRVTPDDRIERVRVAQHLNSIKSKLSEDDKHSDILALLEQEYELLIEHMNAFYAAQKRLLDIKRKKIVKDYKKTDLYHQVQDLKVRFEIKQRNFLNFELTLSDA